VLLKFDMKKTKEQYLAGFISFLMLLSLSCFMLFISWRRWPDILVDFGWELYAPWQISGGTVLYKIVKSAIFGPLSFYVNAALFKIFGVGLTTIIYFNIFIVAILTFLVYRIFLRTMDRTSATAACAGFLGIFAFSQYVGIGNYNFVCPYSHQMTHGIFLSFLAIYLFDIYQKKMSGTMLFLQGIIAGLVFLTKIEVFIAVFTAIAAGMTLLVYLRSIALRDILKMLSILWTGFLIPVLGFALYFARYMPFWEAMDSMTRLYRELFTSPVALNIFYLRVMGIDSPLPNLLKTFLSALKYMVALLTIIAFGKLLSMFSNNRLKAAIALIILVMIYALSMPFINGIFWAQIFRGIPVVIVALVAYFCISILRFKNEAAKARPDLTLFAISVFSLMMIAKMIFNAHVYHYGFALAMPGTLLATACLVHYTPAFFRNKSFESFFVRSLTVMVVAAIIINHIAFSKRMYDLKTYPVGGGPDKIFTYATNISPRGACVNTAVEKIRKLVKEDETLLVLPEGIILNYLSRRASPFWYIHFLPFDQEMVGEDRMLSSLTVRSPDYVALTGRNTLEFGYRGFGLDYGVRVFDWFKENYRFVEKITGASDAGEEFNITIFKRIKAG
jgi:4-amino-4-deoxy-L-arabinose transferase-like glycosyltransferase